MVFHHIGGGEINQTYKVLTDHGIYFVKVHDLERYPKMFEKEVFSLKTILKTETIDVCQPIGICECNGKEFLFIEYLEPVPMNETFWAEFGENWPTFTCVQIGILGLLRIIFLVQ